MAKYNVYGSFTVRSDSPSAWSDISKENAGGNYILRKGEMGWEEGTSNFKIGDGETPYKSLAYIQPIPPSSPYALRLGTEGASYSYEELQNILQQIAGGDFSQIKKDVGTLKVDVQNLKLDLQNAKHLYYPNRSSFPSVGEQGPLYIDKSTGRIYFFNLDAIDGEQIGYVLTNSFDRIECELD